MLAANVILADTSVWINHLRRGEPALADALRNEQVFLHLFVLGELVCTNLRNRRARFHRTPGADGVGYVDVHLLASTSLTHGSRLWTHDKRLALVATLLGLAHS